MEAVEFPIAILAMEDEVWVVGEFSESLHRLDPDGAAELQRLVIPIRASRGSWPYVERRGLRTKQALAERLIEDGRGRLWFPQAGHWSNRELPIDVPSYSRIVSYTPRARKFCIFPVPDNRSGVMGIAWDEAREVIWFSQSGNNALVAFNPQGWFACDSYNNYLWKFDVEGDPVRPLPVSYCEWPDQTNCMRKYSTGTTRGLINQLAVQQPDDPDPGAIWYTHLVGESIGRFDPATGQNELFPLERSQYIVPELPATYFSRLHHIHIHPHDGDLLFSANGRAEVFRFDIQAYIANPDRCRYLDEAGKNPCMTSFQIPMFVEHAGNITTHSMALDRFGNLWVSAWAGACPLDMDPPSIGMINAEWTEMVFLDHLDLPYRDEDGSLRRAAPDETGVPCGEQDRPAWAFKGIDVDDDNNIWVTNYFQRLVHQLEYTGKPDENPYYRLCTECP